MSKSLFSEPEDDKCILSKLIVKNGIKTLWKEANCEFFWVGVYF